MSEVDPNIILQARPTVPLENPMDVQAKGLQLRQLGLQTQAAQRDYQNQQTLADLYKQNIGADGSVDHNAVRAGMAKSGLGGMIPGYDKSLLDATKTKADIGETVAKTGQANASTDKTLLETKLQHVQIVGSHLYSAAQIPNLTHDTAYAMVNSWVNQGIVAPEEGASIARQLPGDPAALKSYMLQKATEGLGIEQQIKAQLETAPKYDEQDRGNVINQGTVDPRTGQRTAGANIDKTMTPDEAAKIKLAQEQGFSTDEGNLFGAIAMRGISLPAGLRSKAQMKATAQSLIAQNPGLTVDEIADKLATGQISFAADKKVSTTAAGIAGKVSYAENEIKNIMPLVREAAAAVPRGQFVPWNKLSQYADTQLSSPELKTLKSYMTTLSNAYDMLAARGGTDMDKRRHNRAMFDTADSPEAMEAAFKAVENEAAISGKAGQTSMVPVSRVTTHDAPAVPVKSDADYNSLKSGTRFVAPDGSVRVKP